MKSTGREKRRYERFTVDVLEINGRMILANAVEIIDMSLGGISIRADRRLNIGNEYTLKIEGRSRTFSLSGAVVWSRLSEMRKGPDGEMIPIYTAGMKFSEVSSEKAAELARFIEEHRQDLLQENDVHELSGLRLNIRFNITDPGRVVLNCPESYRVKKLSLGGMLIESDCEMGVEGVFPMEVSLPEDTLITFLGRVASCITAEVEQTGKYDVGIEFTEMSQKDAKILAKFINTLRKSNKGP